MCPWPFPPSYIVYVVVFFLTTPTVILSWTSLVTPYKVHGLNDAALLTITPRKGTVGPSLWLGIFRSCSQFNESYVIKCDYSSHLAWKPNYDVSVLPPSAPLFTLRVPPTQIRALAWVTTFFSTILLLVSAGMAASCFYFRLPGRQVPRWLAWAPWGDIGRVFYVTCSFCVATLGFMTYSIIWVHFKKVCDNFNLIYRRPGHPLEHEPDINAYLGNVIQMAYAGYILLILPFFIAFVELHQERGTWANLYAPLPGGPDGAGAGGAGAGGAGAGGAGGGG